MSTIVGFNDINTDSIKAPDHKITGATESVSAEIDTIHIEKPECNCLECQKGKKHYVQILDLDRYVNTLNDWD